MLERRCVGMQRRYRLERREIVGVRRAVGLAPRRVQDVHGVAQADPGADGRSAAAVERPVAATTRPRSSA